LIGEEGYAPAGEYVDHETGRKGGREHAAFDEMFAAPENRKFDVLLFWSLGRFSREGIQKTIAYLQQLESPSVRFCSYTEPYLSTENELLSHILLRVLSYFAEYEAKKNSRRTKAGLRRARAKGKELGRPSKFDEHRPELKAMIQEGCSKVAMKRRRNLAYNFVKKYLRRIEADG
jgi:DNA invertase Pin-like site-specific DNA recombinase